MAENPIAEGATQIKEQVRELFTKLDGVYPDNYHYRAGNYPTFVIMKGHGEHGGGFFQQGDLILLSKTGDFTSGRVRQRVGGDHTVWQFSDARLEPSSAMEIVRFSPRLVLNLLDSLASELDEASDPKRIKSSLYVLEKRSEFAGQVISTSRKALLEMGEEDPNIEVGQSDFGQTALRGLSEMLSEIKPSRTGLTLGQRVATFNYFKQKGQLQEAVRELCSNMIASPVEEWFEKLIKEVQDQDLFPETALDVDGTVWFGPTSRITTDDVIKSGHTDYGKNELWMWGISSDGRVREFMKYRANQDRSLILQRCPQHLLEQGPWITESFIKAVIKRGFPKLLGF